MPFVMNLACVNMKMTLPEALNAATINSAASMLRGHSHGSIETGKVADMVILSATKWEHIIYDPVDPPIRAVIKRGKLLHGQ